MNPVVFQAGTGAFQLYLGVNYGWNAGDWNFLVKSSINLPLTESGQGFKPSRFYFAGLTASREIYEKLSFNIGSEIIYSDNDTFSGTEIITRYSVVYLKTGLIWDIDTSTAISGSMTIPLDINVSQTQVAPGAVFQLGISKSF